MQSDLNILARAGDQVHMGGYVLEPVGMNCNREAGLIQLISVKLASSIGHDLSSHSPLVIFNRYPRPLCEGRAILMVHLSMQFSGRGRRSLSPCRTHSPQEAQECNGEKDEMRAVPQYASHLSLSGRLRLDWE